MLTIAYYFLQVVLCSGMMMGYYWLILRNKRFHQYNRFYLLAAALLSWIVPLIKISWSQPVIISEQPQVMQFLSVVADNNSQIEQTINTQPVSEWSRDLLVTGIYFGVAAILFFGMVQAFIKLYRLLRDHSCKNVGDVYLVLTQAKGTPFSFFRYIFWNEEIDLRSEAGKQILQHELTHVQQKHSFDKLFIQLMLIGGWFNPFFWLLKKEMDMIHEFIADKKAVNNGDTAALAQMLLTAAYPRQQFALTHPFFFSPIKRRLQMLTNNKNPRYSYIRRLVVLPLLAIVIVLFAFRSKERRENAEISVATVMENVATDQKQFFNSFLQGIGNFFEDKKTDQNDGFHSIFYNGRPLTVPTSFRLKDLTSMMVMPHLDKDHLNLVPSLDITANAADPLYVIDGKIQATKIAFNTLKPEDIQMIQVWKGISAIAKYGDAGKDGVIEITTKAFADRKGTDGFSGLVYEGVAKDPMGNVVGNRVTYLKVTIYQGETEKTKVWEETHVVQSNDNGIITFTLGKDVKSSTKPEGEMEKLDWTQGPYFVNLAAAVAPSIQASWWIPQDNYVDHGTTKMATIPFPVIVTAQGYPPRQVSFAGRGKDVTIPSNTTAIVTIEFTNAKKGDQVYVTAREKKLTDWAVYSAWVEEDGVIKIRFANYTDKQVSVGGDEYMIGLAKFEGLQPHPNWVQKYDSEALIVVDGVVYKEGLYTINPNEISSIDVLKDAKSIEKYGTAGRNGVIEITTKSRNFSFRLKDAEEKNKENLRLNDLPSFAVSSIALDPLGNAAKNRKVFVKDIIYQGNAVSGMKVWEETHEVSTNDDGIFTINIGRGAKTPSTVATDLGKIDWSKGPFYVNYKVAVYPSIPAAWWVAKENLVDVGTTQLLSLPYALYNGKPNNNTGIQPGAPNTFLITDSLGEVNWKPAPSIRVQGRKINEPSVWLRERQVPAKDPGVSDGILKARSIPSATIAEGMYLDNSPAILALKKRNPDVEIVYWKDKTHFGIQLKDKTNETYDITNPESKKRAETKYGKLPEVPAVVTNAPVRDEVTVVGHGSRNAGKTPLSGISVPGTIRGGTFSGTLSANTYNLNLASAAGKDAIIGPNTTTAIIVDVPGVKKGDPIIVTPQQDGLGWSIYSAWVSEDNKVKIRFANYTDKELKVFGTEYKIVVIKNYSDTEAGEDITIPALTTALTTVTIPGVKKGDTIVATPQGDYNDWAIYSAWVSEDNKVNVRFANYTDKSVKVSRKQYKIVVIKS